MAEPRRFLRCAYSDRAFAIRRKRPCGILGRQVLARSRAECLLEFGCVNAGEPDLVLCLAGIEHRDRVAIMDADNVAGEGGGFSPR